MGILGLKNCLGLTLGEITGFMYSYAMLPHIYTSSREMKIMFYADLQQALSAKTSA